MIHRPKVVSLLQERAQAGFDRIASQIYVSSVTSASVVATLGLVTLGAVNLHG